MPLTLYLQFLISVHICPSLISVFCYYFSLMYPSVCSVFCSFVSPVCHVSMSVYPSVSSCSILMVSCVLCLFLLLLSHQSDFGSAVFPRGALSARFSSCVSPSVVLSPQAVWFYRFPLSFPLNQKLRTFKSLVSSLTLYLSFFVVLNFLQQLSCLLQEGHKSFLGQEVRKREKNTCFIRCTCIIAC